jgi:hypothetical protein
VARYRFLPQEHANENAKGSYIGYLSPPEKLDYPQYHFDRVDDSDD